MYTFSAMKKASLLFILFGLFAVNSSAQKLDIDKKSITTQMIDLPTKTVDTTWHNFAYTFKGAEYLSAWGIDESQVRDQYFKLFGYNSVGNSGDLNLEATLYPVRIKDFNVQNRTETSKDKSGRTTSTTYYKYVLTYESGFNWKMKDKNGKEVSDKLQGLITTGLKKKEGAESTNYKTAYEEYNNNRAQINRDIATAEITGYFRGMYAEMNNQFGYAPYTERFSIWVVDSKSHPEMEKSKEMMETVKAAFANIQTSGVSSSDMEALQPAIDYYKSWAEKYKSAEKADAKMRYAAFYNLANIYLHLDELDTALEYANLIITNEHEKGDGKDFIKEIEKLRELFNRKRVPARRFPR